MVVNPDRSLDIYFGPKAPRGAPRNWIQKCSGKGWNVMRQPLSTYAGA